MSERPLYPVRELPPPIPLSEAERAEFIALFNPIPADQVKALAQRWVGKGARTRKQECVQQLLEVLASPTALKSLYDNLSPFEKYGLQVLVERGGTLPSLELAPCLVASGHPFREHGFQIGLHYSYPYYSTSSYPYLKAVSRLAASGLTIHVQVDSWYNHLDPTPFYHHTYAAGVTLLGRMLPYVQPYQVVPLDLRPCEENPSGEFRRPAEAAMPFNAVLEALRGLGEFTLNARGGFNKPIVTRVAKKLDCEAMASAARIDDPVTFYLRLCVSADLLEKPDFSRSTALSLKADELMEQPYEIQAFNWLNAYRSLKGWFEPLPAQVYFYQGASESTNPLNAFRNLLITALSALPHPDAWYTVAEFSDALYSRAGALFSLRHLHDYFPRYGLSEAQKKEGERQHLAKRHASWRGAEEPLMQRIIQGPLFALGITEVGTLAGGAAAFRLTDLGRAVLHGIPIPANHSTDRVQAGAWVVQPNLEIVAYLDRAQPNEVAFLNRIAERKSSTGLVVVYTLTRESIYGAMEGGYSAESLIEGLRNGSAKELPDVVSRNIREWGARRERISMFPVSALLQYADSATRDAALATLPAGSEAVGDRYIIILNGDVPEVIHRIQAPWIDYSGAPHRCVEIDESGALRVDTDRSDLLIGSELNAFADPTPGTAGEWMLTHDSIQRAVGAGHTPDGILKALGQRARTTVPPILSVAIPRWARKSGQAAPATLKPVLVFQTPTVEMADAVAASRRFAGIIKKRLGPSAFEIDSEDEPEVRRLMSEYGLDSLAGAAGSATGTGSTPASRAGQKGEPPATRRRAPRK